MGDAKFCLLVLVAVSLLMAFLCVAMAPEEEQAEFNRAIAEVVIDGPDASYVRDGGK